MHSPVSPSCCFSSPAHHLRTYLCILNNEHRWEPHELLCHLNSEEKKNKIELSHTSQAENPDHLIHFLHCNKGNKMRPYGGLNGDVWLAFSLHPTDVKSTCQAAERGPLVSSFVISFCQVSESFISISLFGKVFCHFAPTTGLQGLDLYEQHPDVK